MRSDADFSDNDRTIKVYRLKVPFSESQATWEQASNGEPWDSPGASGTADRESTDIGSILIDEDEPLDIEKQISLSTTQIQQMVSGAFVNNGFIIIADNEEDDRFSYRTSDASAATKRPKLVIHYTTSSSTPTHTPTPGPSPTATRTPTPGASPTPTATQPPQGAFNSATFVYDGDGKRVKSVFNGTTTTYFVGNHYEVTGSTITKYYYAGAQRIAMRTNGTLNFLLGDHLGSTSLITDSTGNKTNEQRYKAWGETRYTFGSEKTKYQYTGQFSYVSDFGLMYYGARWYDTSLGRFNQPDTIIPPIQGVQAWDRYAYSNNNPVKYTDPSGHFIETAWDFAMIGVDLIDIAQNGLNWSNGAALAVDVASAIIPGIPAVGGVLLKTAKAANALDNAVDAVNAVDNAVDTANAVDNAADMENMIDATCSFSADTQVTTQEGWESIAAIEIGDYVLAWNEADGTLGYYEVTATWSHADKVLTELIIDGDWIETTPEHPFYVEGKGWTPADELKTGMLIRQADGTMSIVWLKWNIYKTQEMYNLTVDTAHTFFVGEGQWLVHNECFPYKDRADYLLPGQQANHLNQNAAFESVIPRDEGVSIALYGNAITDIGSEHYVFHQVMERFWEIYRSGSEVGNIPTIRQYSSAMELALQYAGLSNRQIAEAVAAARKNRQMFGLRDLDLVPRIPGRLHQVR